MLPRFLLDTHVAIRWLVDPRKLSREQLRTLEATERRSEPVAFSPMSLIEAAMLTSEGKLRMSLEDFFELLRTNAFFRILPLSYEIASEVASLGRTLRDPADRIIVATARVHRLRLITSDQRIIESKLVPVLE